MVGGGLWRNIHLIISNIAIVPCLYQKFFWTALFLKINAIFNKMCFYIKEKEYIEHGTKFRVSEEDGTLDLVDIQSSEGSFPRYAAHTFYMSKK